MVSLSKACEPASLGYEVTYSADSGNVQPPVGVIETKGPTPGVTLTSLVTGVTYNLTVKARNSVGVGPPATIENYKLAGGMS